MPAYSFEALQSDGTLRKGVVEADNAKAARSQLRAQSMVPLAVQVLGTQGTEKKSIWQYNIGSSRCFSPNTLAVWTRQLASLVSSGLPLERALTALSDEAESEKQAHLVASLRAEVNAGLGLAKAMAQHPTEFSALYTAVISAGEQGGNLGQVLNQLADDLQDQQNLKAKLLSASLYPAIVSAIALFIVIFLLSTVVPQVAQVFAGSVGGGVGVLCVRLVWFLLCALSVFPRQKNPPLPFSAANKLKATHWAIDELKAVVPIWKKEMYDDGSCWKENAESRAAQVAAARAQSGGVGA
jgi:type II secretory pathway component PulF